MRVEATAKWVRITAQKARLVAHTVEGLPVQEALTILQFTTKYAAVEVAKVIKSAAANAEHNFELDPTSLFVDHIDVDGATILKRMRPKPRGVAGSIFKRTSHIKAWVTDEPKVKGAKKLSAKAAASAPKATTKRRAAASKSAAAATAAADQATAETAAKKTKATTKTAAKPASKASAKTTTAKPTTTADKPKSAPATKHETPEAAKPATAKADEAPATDAAAKQEKE